ncbi:hypothetical protein MRB53_038071 [Persea americana]|nr:hypothetical protein MRB53_038071 [Persea americana]
MILRISSVGSREPCGLSSAPFTAALGAGDIPADTPVSQVDRKCQHEPCARQCRRCSHLFRSSHPERSEHYLTVFKRGATYLSLGRNVQASRDFDQVLVLKPGFEGALTQRAKIKSRNGDWNGARADYNAAGKAGTQELADLDEAEGAAKLSSEAEGAGDWDNCITHAGTAILVAGYDIGAAPATISMSGSRKASSWRVSQI